jgi:hypothetical protein
MTVLDRTSSVRTRKLGGRRPSLPGSCMPPGGTANALGQMPAGQQLHRWKPGLAPEPKTGCQPFASASTPERGANARSRRTRGLGVTSLQEDGGRCTTRWIWMLEGGPRDLSMRWVMTELSC